MTISAWPGRNAAWPNTSRSTGGPRSGGGGRAPERAGDRAEALDHLGKRRARRLAPAGPELVEAVGGGGGGGWVWGGGGASTRPPALGGHGGEEGLGARHGRRIYTSTGRKENGRGPSDRTARSSSRRALTRDTSRPR